MIRLDCLGVAWISPLVSIRRRGTGSEGSGEVLRNGRAAIRKEGEPIGRGAGGGPGKRRAVETTLIYLDYLGFTASHRPRPSCSSSSSERSDLPVVATTPTCDLPAWTQTHAVSVPFFDILIKSRFERRATAPQTHPPGKRRLRLRVAAPAAMRLPLRD